MSGEIADYLFSSLQSGTDAGQLEAAGASAEPPNAAAESPARMTAALLEEMSDEEVERLLNEKLERL